MTGLQRSYPIRAAGRCVHYRGLFEHGGCSAGVRYEDVLGGRKDHVLDRLPCFTRAPTTQGVERECCGKFQEPTEQEIEEYQGRVLAELAKHDVVLNGILPWREANKGKSVAEIVECPACKGQLHLSIARSNGHVHGKCATEGCVAWRE